MNSQSNKGGLVAPKPSSSNQIIKKRWWHISISRRKNKVTGSSLNEERNSRMKSEEQSTHTKSASKKDKKKTTAKSIWNTLFKSKKGNKINNTGSFHGQLKLPGHEDYPNSEISYGNQSSSQTPEHANNPTPRPLPASPKKSNTKIESANQRTEVTNDQVYVPSCTCNDDPSNVLSKFKIARKPVGLKNLGNSCFFNAVMQNLNQTFVMHTILQDVREKQGCYGPLTQSLLKFNTAMSSESANGRHKPVNPSELFYNICERSKKFRHGQHDSHELLRHLLDGLRVEERQASGGKRNMPTTVDRVFGGHMLTVYICETCQQPYHVCEPMLDISLPIAFSDAVQGITRPNNNTETEPQKTAMTPLADSMRPRSQHQRSNSARVKPYSIEDCLDAFTRTEYISDEYLCLACNENRSGRGKTGYILTSAWKRSLVYNPPPILTLHLKRFKQTARGFIKCDEQIEFAETLDLGSFCQGNEGYDTSIWYSLYGIVVHSGSLDVGHYVAYVKIRQPDDDIRQFLQESFLDRAQLPEEKLAQLIKEMKGQFKRSPRKERTPPPAAVAAAVNGTWFYISDSNCYEVKDCEVLSCHAYLLFYKRLAFEETRV